jgi:hypothetical protein
VVCWDWIGEDRRIWRFNGVARFGESRGLGGCGELVFDFGDGLIGELGAEFGVDLDGS